MRQVDLAQRALVHAHVHEVARLLDAVQGEMFDAGHDIVALNPRHQGAAHLAQQVRVFAVGLLRPAPARVAEQVDADAAEQVGALGAELLADGVSDAQLERAVEAGAPRHRHRERRGVVHHHAPRSVGEGERRHQQPPIPPGEDRAVVVLVALHGDELDEVQEPGVAGHLLDPLLEAHLRQ